MEIVVATEIGGKFDVLEGDSGRSVETNICWIGVNNANSKIKATNTAPTMIDRTLLRPKTLCPVESGYSNLLKG